MADQKPVRGGTRELALAAAIGKIKAKATAVAAIRASCSTGGG